MSKSQSFVPQPADHPTSATAEELLEDAVQSEVQRLCKRATPEIVGALLGIVTDTRRATRPDENGDFEILEKDLQYPTGPRVTAGRALLEQGHGRPTQRVEHKDERDGGLQIVIQQISKGDITEIDITPTPKASMIEDRSPEPVEAS